jgi:hypothetical protein
MEIWKLHPKLKHIESTKNEYTTELVLLLVDLVNALNNEINDLKYQLSKK